MVTYITQAPAHAGGTIPLTTPGGLTGDFAPTGTGLGLLVQQGTAPGTVILPFAPTVDGLAVTSRQVPCPAGQLVLIPLPNTVYGVGTTAVQYTNITTAQVASVQIAT